MFRPQLLVLALALPLVACNHKPKVCEHARDVFIAEAKRQIDEAVSGANPETRARVRKQADDEVARATTIFVEQCLELGEEDIACLERIDELVAKKDQDDPCAKTLVTLRDRVYARTDE